MRRILRETPVRELIGDILGMVALCILLYALTVLGAGLVP